MSEENKYYDIKIFEDGIECETIRDLNLVQKTDVCAILDRLGVKFKVNVFDKPLFHIFADRESETK